MELDDAWLKRPTFLLLLEIVCSVKGSPFYRLPKGQDAIKAFISFFGYMRAEKLSTREIDRYAENRSNSASPERVQQEVRFLHAIKDRGDFMLANRRAALLARK